MKIIIPKNILAILFCTFSVMLMAQSDFVDLFEKVSPTVVVIKTYSEDGLEIGQGSGFMINDDGIIATNYHVIDGAKMIIVSGLGEEPVYAKHVLKSDPEWDIALIKVPGAKYNSISLNEIKKAKVGSRTVAIGSPYGLSNTISEGIISGVREYYGKSLIQITNPISSGSSGGALLTIKGELIGITTLVIDGGQNLNFAVPASELKRLYDSSEKSDKITLKKKIELSEEEKKFFADTMDIVAFQKKVEANCNNLEGIYNVINDAISIGAPTYNAGNHVGCYRIYEGACYKILQKFSDDCPAACDAIAVGLKQAENNLGAIDKAWTLRQTFDLILGVPTERGSQN